MENLRSTSRCAARILGLPCTQLPIGVYPKEPPRGGGITQSDGDKTNTHNNDRINNNKTIIIIIYNI
jgi:hypothetical protein